MLRNCVVLLLMCSAARADVDPFAALGIKDTPAGSTLQLVQRLHPDGELRPIEASPLGYTQYYEVMGDHRAFGGYPVRLTRYWFPKEDKLRRVGFVFGDVDSADVLRRIVAVLGANYRKTDRQDTVTYLWDTGAGSHVFLLIHNGGMTSVSLTVVGPGDRTPGL